MPAGDGGTDDFFGSGLFKLLLADNEADNLLCGRKTAVYLVNLLLNYRSYVVKFHVGIRIHLGGDFPLVVIDNDFLYRLKGDKLILNFLGKDVLAVREDNQVCRADD